MSDDAIAILRGLADPCYMVAGLTKATPDVYAELIRAGLVEHLPGFEGRPFYRITDSGRGFLTQALSNGQR